MRNFIGYCGIDCEKCDAYLATIHNDDVLRGKTAKLWAELNQVPILPEHINCQGCRMDGVKTVFCDSLCAIRKCAISRGVKTCGACPEMAACETLAAITANNPEAKKNLDGKADGCSPFLCGGRHKTRIILSYKRRYFLKTNILSLESVH